MIEKGKLLPNGQRANLRWIHGRVESVDLFPPYSMITGADSLHWLDWDIAFPRFREMLTPNGVVAVLSRGELPTIWHDRLRDLIARFSLVQNYEPFDLIEELEKRKLFRPLGDTTTLSVTSSQSISDYINSFHSRTSLSLKDMPPEDAFEFDRQLAEIVIPYSENGFVELQTEARITWGKAL
jgi:hypothetical protein